MSFLSNIFNTDPDTPSMWKILNSKEQLAQIRMDSHQKPVVIYKHSISCGLSSIRRSHLIKDWDFNDSHLDFYFLDLIRKRPVSNAVEEIFDVLHESPQILIVYKGEVIYHTSHHDVSVESIRNGLLRVKN